MVSSPHPDHPHPPAPGGRAGGKIKEHPASRDQRAAGPLYLFRRRFLEALDGVTIKVPMHIAVAAKVMPAAFEHQGKTPVITSAGAVVVSSRMLRREGKREEGKKKDGGKRSQRRSRNGMGQGRTC